MLGVRIGTYTIHKLLGEGGMGSVYLAEHALLGRRAAIKVLLPAMSANQEIVNRFFNEARATTAITDPGIVQVFDFGYHTDGSAYIVMELLDGESMATRLERLGRLAPRDAFRLMKQVAISLGAAHARGIVHRDLKPDNLFVVGDAAVTGGERMKILDFGIAKLAGDDPGRMKTRTGAVMGTPLFMSPEQCRGVSGIDHRADIYSLGCVMFLAITGRAPFDGEGVGDILFGHMGKPAPAPSSVVPVPPVVDQIILRCLAKLPGERFQTMAELVNAMTAAEPYLFDVGGRPSTSPIAVAGGAGAVTTFSGASGQSMHQTLPPQKSSRAGLFALLGLGIVGGVIAIVAVAGGGKKDAVTPASGSAPIAAPATPDAGLAPIAIDAAVVPVAVDAAVAVVVDAAVVPVAVDAAVAPAIDAAVPEVAKPKPKPRPRPKDKPMDASSADRGD
jgi:serine/threonine protein kinase